MAAEAATEAAPTVEPVAARARLPRRRPDFSQPGPSSAPAHSAAPAIVARHPSRGRAQPCRRLRRAHDSGRGHAAARHGNHVPGVAIAVAPRAFTPVARGKPQAIVAADIKPKEVKPPAADRSAKAADTVTRRPETLVKRPRAVEEAEDEEARTKKKGGLPVKPTRSPVKAAEERRERGRLTINNAFDEQQRERSLASLKRKRERER